MMRCVITSSVFNERIIERCSAAILAVAALATSWSGYQATLFNGDQLRLMAQAQQQLQCGSRAFATAGQQRTVDVVTFVSWLSARAANERNLMRFFELKFRPELRTAFDAWLATSPATNPKAPGTPFMMPQYRLEAEDTAARCDRASARAFEAAHDANMVGDRYMFATVVFAIALFFAGGMPNLRVRGLRVAMLAIAVAAVLTGIALLSRLPRA